MKKLIASLFTFMLLLPQRAFAHEVYVLPEEVIEGDLASSNINPFDLLYIAEHKERFIFFALIYIFLIILLVKASWSIALQEKTASFIASMKNYAGTVLRIFAGLSLVAASLNGSIFGPELPVDIIYNSELIRTLEFVVGVMLVIGFLTRVAAAGVALLFAASLALGSEFALSYIVYIGVVAYCMGWTKFCLDLKFLNPRKHLVCFQDNYAEMFLRVTLGLSLLWSAVYVKILHTPLALEVVNTFELTRFIPFDPLFIVLGAALVEISIALSFLFGFLVRFNAIFLLFWVILSISFFGEALWPHLILIGAALAVFMQGYDKYSLFGIFKKDKEPVF